MKINLDSGYLESDTMRVFFDAGSDLVRITSNDDVFGASGLNVAIKRDSPGDHAARLALARSGISIVPSTPLDIEPLNKFHLVEDVEVKRGKELTAQLGTTATGPLMFTLNEAHPHLAVFGSSGCGKSILLGGLIYQWLQQRCEMWMIEPKNELHTWKEGVQWGSADEPDMPMPRQFDQIDRSQVTRFIDSWSGEEDERNTLAALNRHRAMSEPELRLESFVRLTRELLARAVVEMNRRRQMAEGGSPAMTNKPLVIVIESADYFFGEDPDFQIMELLSELLRKGGSADIHLVMASQRADDTNFPSMLREQMTVVGMKTRTAADSRILIGQPGLEKITIKGVGVLKAEGAITPFRALWLPPALV